MAKPRRSFSQLSRRSQQIAIKRGDEYGLTREQTRQRYNRGSFNPFARKDPMLRIPGELRRYAVELDDGRIVVDWADASFAHVTNTLGTIYGFNENTVQENIYDHASDAMRRLMYFSGEDELRQWARPQPDAEGEPPDIGAWVGLPSGFKLSDVGYRIDGKWYNVFWYH